MKNLYLENVEEIKGFTSPDIGAYVGVIKNVFDNTEKGCLELELDIAEGPMANYYEGLHMQKGFWALKAFQNYESKDAAKDKFVKGFFKGFITRVETSNPGYKFNYDEKTLIGKRVGMILGKKEYTGNDGSIKTKVYLHEFKKTEDIANGNYTLPAFKELENKAPVVEEYDGDLPF